MAVVGENNNNAIEGRRSRRLVFAYQAGSLTVVGIGLVWGVFFLSTGWWSLACVDFVLAGVGVLSWLLIHKGRPSDGLLLSQLALFSFALVFCLYFDVPSQTAPRVCHLYLLVLAMLGYINYLREPSRLQAVLVGMCLVAFVAFASAILSFPFAQPIPDEFRTFGSWINVIVATVMLCGCAYVMQLEFARTNSFARELESALWNREFIVYYQPQVDRAGRTLGAEALLRWKSPQRGFVSPGEFIPMAEQAGLMVKIGAWVLDEACKTLTAWSQHPATADLTLAVNVSSSQFLDDNFEQSVIRAIRTHGINPKRLKLELTESVMVADMESVVRKMQTLREANVSFALDDFGTGYSSLAYLRSLPLHQLKIDRSFVLDMVESKRSATLVRNIIHLGKDLDLVVLAEGVETREQFNLLVDSGCSEFQGFLFGRPMPIEEFEQALTVAVAA